MIQGVANVGLVLKLCIIKLICKVFHVRNALVVTWLGRNMMKASFCLKESRLLIECIPLELNRLFLILRVCLLQLRFVGMFAFCNDFTSQTSFWPTVGVLTHFRLKVIICLARFIPSFLPDLKFFRTLFKHILVCIISKRWESLNFYGSLRTVFPKMLFRVWDFRFLIFQLQTYFNFICECFVHFHGQTTFSPGRAGLLFTAHILVYDSTVRRAVTPVTLAFFDSKLFQNNHFCF